MVSYESMVELARKSQFASLTQFAILGRVVCERLVFNNLFVFLDINECMLYPNVCGTAICKNILGNYECECAEGYTYNKTSKNCEGRSSLPLPTPFSFFCFPLFWVFF